MLADSTFLTSIVPLPVEYERDPYRSHYVRDRRVPDHATIVHDVPSQERHERMRYSDWPRRLRRWRVIAYSLGILLTVLSVVSDFADEPLLSFLPLRLVVALAFGIYVGMKEIHQSEWRIWHTVGVLAGVLTVLLSYGYSWLIPSVSDQLFYWSPAGGSERTEGPNTWVYVLVTYVLGTWLAFISGVLLGRGVQQKAEQERWGARNVADAVQQGQVTGPKATRTAAILGLVGILGAALIESIAPKVLAAILGGGN